MDTLELYVYTTTTYEKEGLLKVGHCIKGRHEKRIKEQFNASNPELPITLWVKELSKGKEDKHIHKQLKKNGIKRKEDGKGTEWFYATLDDVKKAYNEITHGVARKDNFLLREEQKKAVEKAKSWFKKEHSFRVIDSASHKDRFLLNAKMRFGKCFTSIHIAKAIKAKKTIIVTYKPSVIEEWLDTVNNHIDFKDWTGVRAKEGQNPNEHFLNKKNDLLKISTPLVFCVSLQDLDISEAGSIKTRLADVLKTNWDLLIFDEVHFGGRTDRVEKIFKHLNPQFRLDLSGTPFRLMEHVDFCPEQIFTYSYLDEQKNKKKEIKNDPKNEKPFIYRAMPDLKLSTIEITDKDIQTQREKFLTDDRDFSLNKLFKANTKEFIHNEAVDHFLSNLSNWGLDATATSVYGRLGEQLGLPKKKHSIWWLHRVSSIKQLIKKLNAHPIFSSYEIIDATGGKSDSDSNDTTDEKFFVKGKEDILNKIKKVNSGSLNKAGTITLTCRKFLTGVTIRPWDSILILNDIESAESYYQAIFRVQSAWVEKGKILKKTGWIFDFAISRCLRTTFRYASALVDQQDNHNQLTEKDNLKKTLNSLCEDLCIKTFYEGKLKSDSVTSNEVFEAMRNEGSKVTLSKRITSDMLVSFPALASLKDFPQLYEALKNVKGYRTHEAGSIDSFIQIGKDAKEKLKLKKEDVFKEDNEIEKEVKNEIEKEKDKEKKRKKRWYATQIKRLAICMADFIYMTECREYKIDQVIETRDSKLFHAVTGIDKDIFKELCNQGFIRKEALNRIVREFRIQEDSSLKPEKFIFDLIKNNIITDKAS